MRFRAAQKRQAPSEKLQTSPGDVRRSVKKIVGSLASVAVVASSVIVGGVVTAVPASAAEPFQCTPGSVYVQSSDEVREFVVDENGSELATSGMGSKHSTNGLGISSAGQYAYTVTNSPGEKRLAKYDRASDELLEVDFTLTESLIRGAVNPTTQTYYFATATIASGTFKGGIKLYAWDEAAGAPVQVGTLRPTGSSRSFEAGSNGDMAFSASGQLLIVANNLIYSADIPSSLAKSEATIDAKKVFEMDDDVLGNGIAFGNLGHIFVSTSNSIIEVDLARSIEVDRTKLERFSPTDMASCTFPNTVTLKKDLPEGRHAAADQFSLQIDAPRDYKITQTTAVTTGGASGLQPDYAGPFFTNQGDSFILSESASGMADLDGYAASLICEQRHPADEDHPGGWTEPVSMDGNRVTQPAGSLGTEVVCTFTNAKLAPDLALRKTSDPASGTAVAAGQAITYTVEAENTGNTTLDPVEIADDLTDVLANAEYQDDVTTEIDGTAVTSGAAAVTGDDLAWTGALEPGQIASITYSVIVNDDVAGETIANSVTASGTPPAPLDRVTPPVVTTEHPVAGFTIDKIADPASGTVVEPGQTIMYTVTGTNTGETALEPVAVADDLTGVLAHAEYNGDITTAINGTAVTSGAATISENDLAWNGVLQSGETVTITYSVTVGEETSGEILTNVATGSARPMAPNPADPSGPQIPGEPILPPSATTEHPVIGSGFTVSKTADPASGTAVQAGDTITYTVTGTNTGDTDLDPAEIVDDLSGVLAYAEYDDDVSASRGTAGVANDTLTWTGTIPQNESVTITYSVTVDADVQSALLTNTATGEATPQIPTDPSDPESLTTPAAPITPPASETAHPVVDNGFEISKSADPASGTAVRAGDTIKYTVTGTNTGNTVLDPASITDDLSAVLASAQYNDDVAATVGSAQVVGNTLSWAGALAPGDAVSITYSVTVNADATGVLLRNIVDGVATPLIPKDPTDPASPTGPGEPVSPPQVTTEHPVVNPGFAIAKSANPQSGTSVDPGSVIEYTVTGTNTGDAVLEPAAITDNLAGVLANAQYNDDIEASNGTAEVTGNTLSWTGALEPGEDVVITYSVTVDADADGSTLRNSVTGTATPLMPADPSDPASPTTPGAAIVPPTATTQHPVNEPGFTFTKSVDPASGTAVDPGQVLTYTVTGTNTGETALNTVDIVDDLSGVLGFATYNDDAAAIIGTDAAAAPSIADDELTWTGSLEVDQAVTITYSVTVGPDAVGEVLENSATGSATPPGGQTITPPSGITANPVNVPGFSVSKSASPEAGTAVDPGSVITYTVTGVNTGETALDEVEIIDDLSSVLAHAAYNGDAIAAVGDAVAAAPSVADGSLSWTGALQVGQTVTITYSVTVNGDAGGEIISNSVEGIATPPGGVPPIETPPAVTEHPVNEPGFSVEKSADPASGTRIDPGSIISYTVTGINTGETVLDEVLITDSLVGVLQSAVYNDDAAASIDGAAVVASSVSASSVSAPSVSGDALSWRGALAIGERVTITYSVTVNGDAGGSTLENSVSGAAVPPGGEELTPPPSTTEHPVGEPGFTFEKTSDPGSGTKIAAGSTVTYTLTGVNIGETGLDSVTIVDSLDEVLPLAKFNDDVVVKVGDQIVAAPALKDGLLSWNGSLGLGESVTITYSVTVAESAAGETLRNVAVASATPPGGVELTLPASETDHPVLTPLAITGLALTPWMLALIPLLLGFGTLMLVLWRRERQVA